MSRKRPAAATTKQKASPAPETAEQSAAPDDYAWYQHVGWWVDAHPADVQDRLRAAQAEYDVDGEKAPGSWVVVPGWFVRDYFGLEAAFSEAQKEIATLTDRAELAESEASRWQGHAESLASNMGEQLAAEPEVDWCGAWYQTPGWWADDSPPVVASRVQAAVQEAGHDGWVLVPAGYIEKYRSQADERLTEEEEYEAAAGARNRRAVGEMERLAAREEIRDLACDILMELIRTKGDSTEWPRVAWERARKFVDEEARKS